MKEVKHENVNLQEAMEEIMKNRDKILEDFAKAYLAEKKVNPSDIELVQQKVNSDDGIEYIFYFRIKNDTLKKSGYPPKNGG